MDDADRVELDHYEELSFPERERISRAMKNNDGYSDDISEARHLASVLDTARRFDAEPIPDDVLAYLAVMKMVDEQPREADMQQQFVDLEESIREDPQLKKRYNAIAAAIEKLDEHSDARLQFESLVDRTLDGEGGGDADSEIASEDNAPTYLREQAVQPIQPQESFEGKPSQGSRSSDHDLSSSVNTSKSSFTWGLMRSGLALAAVVVLVVTSLFMLSYLVTPDYQRLAYFDAEELRVEGFGDVTRSGGVQQVDVEQRAYLNGLQAYEAARVSTLGLFPRYDMDQVRAAEDHFFQVVNTTEEGGFLHTEALFWQAQTFLLQGEPERAAESLRQVVAFNGRMADEAESQLAQLE